MESPRLVEAKKYFFVYCLLLALAAGTSVLVVWGTSGARRNAPLLIRDPGNSVLPGNNLPESD